MRDLPREFYLQTMREVLQEYHLPLGKLAHRGPARGAGRHAARQAQERQIYPRARDFIRAFDE